MVLNVSSLSRESKQFKQTHYTPLTIYLQEISICKIISLAEQSITTLGVVNLSRIEKTFTDSWTTNSYPDNDSLSESGG